MGRALLPLLWVGIPSIHAQQTETIRHHRIAENDPAAAELIRAEDAIEKKDYATAETILEKLTAEDATRYQGWFDLGFVYNAQGKIEDSIAAYRKSVTVKPDVFESNLDLGLMLARAHNPDAEQFLRAATTLKPTANVDEGRARAWLSLAHTLENTKPLEAIAAYQEAARLQPKDPEPHFSAAQLMEKQGQFAEAGKECEIARTLDPASQEALTCSAEMAIRAKNYSQAEVTLKRLTELHPDDAKLQVQLARALAMQDKNDDALVALQMAIKLDPQNTEAQNELAFQYFKTGKYAQAEPMYRALIGTKPNDAELHARLGQALLKQLKYGPAEQEFLVAVKLKPDFGEAYGDLATAAAENKDYLLAIKAVNARDKFLPPLAVGYFLRASAFDHLQDVKQASENYHRFLQLADGKYPDQEWQARHRLIAIEPKK
jgi:tetratricopeptide (TPR) repeat protein